MQFRYILTVYLFSLLMLRFNKLLFFFCLFFSYSFNKGYIYFAHFTFFILNEEKTNAFSLEAGLSPQLPCFLIVLMLQWVSLLWCQIPIFSHIFHQLLCLRCSLTIKKLNWHVKFLLIITFINICI